MILPIERLKLRLLLHIAGQLTIIAGQTKAMTVSDRQKIADDFTKLEQAVKAECELQR